MLSEEASPRDIIAVVMKKAGADSGRVLDDIKNMGYRMAFQGGGLSSISTRGIIPEEKGGSCAGVVTTRSTDHGGPQHSLIINNERYKLRIT